MSLCRYLATPSDRMAVIWSLLSIEGAIVLEYGPAGTTHFSMGLYGTLGIDWQQRLFTTHMSEDDVVMGDVTRLEEAIVELDAGYEPQVLFVVASSISSVIGTDLKGVCNYMQQEVSCRLIPVEQGGFRGDYSMGLRDIQKQLVRVLPKDGVSKKPDTYNILGASMGRYRMASDVWEIENLLAESFGLTLHTSLCCHTSIEELETMGCAAVNIVVSAEGIEAAELLQQRFGTPYVYWPPYGYQKTLDMLRQVGSVLGRQPDRAVMMRIGMKMRSMSMFRMYGMMGGSKEKPQALVKGDYDLVVGLSAMLADAGLTVTQKICSHSLKSIRSPEDGVVSYPVEKDWIRIIAAAQHAFVLGDDVALLQCDDTNTKLRVSSPFINGSQVATHLPLMGEKGADFLMEYIEQYYQILT